MIGPAAAAVVVRTRCCLVWNGRAALAEVADRRNARGYLLAFWLALAMCWSPIKALGYAAPWVCVAFLLATTRSRVLAGRLAVVGLTWILLSVGQALLSSQFIWEGAVLSVVTYGAVVLALVVPASFLRYPLLYTILIRSVYVFMAVEGIWGVVQGTSTALAAGHFDGAVGDAVAGTIRPFTVSPDFSNPMFAVNLVFMCFAALPIYANAGRARVALPVAVLAIIMASVMHVLILMTLAIVFSCVIFYPGVLRRRVGCYASAALLVAGALAFTMLPGNFATARNYARYTAAGVTPRAKVVLRSLTIVPDEYPWMPVVGLGPGQFSSRAGLIASGMYFGTPANPTSLPLLKPAMSGVFRSYVLDLWMSLFYDRHGNYIHAMDNTSTSVTPYFSWLSVYTEYGAIAVLAVVTVCAALLWQVRRRVRDRISRTRALVFAAGLIFLLLLGIQDNYWEIPQAVLLGIMLLKAQYSQLVYGEPQICVGGGVRT